jgi:hypothetical protein
VHHDKKKEKNSTIRGQAKGGYVLLPRVRLAADRLLVGKNDIT